jgi:hypothetical protein
LGSQTKSSTSSAEASTSDLDRFEAAFPNDLWQSDMLCGPWLPDPDNPGQRRRTWLHAWLDHHSRLLLAGRWSFRCDLPVLELTFREAVRRCGVPKRVYYDYGGPYRSHHMRQIVAVLSNQKPIFTVPRRPEGHGKIEAFNRYCRAAFVEEVKASAIQSLDQLNRAFAAWRDLKYGRRPHSEIGATPWDRWRAHPERVVVASERLLRHRQDSSARWGVAWAFVHASTWQTSSRTSARRWHVTRTSTAPIPCSSSTMPRACAPRPWTWCVA